jgi:hypothetical protein
VRLTPGNAKDTGVEPAPAAPLPAPGSADAAALDKFADCVEGVLFRIDRKWRLEGLTITKILTEAGHTLPEHLHAHIRLRLATDERFVRGALKSGRIRLKSHALAEEARLAAKAGRPAKSAAAPE